MHCLKACAREKLRQWKKSVPVAADGASAGTAEAAAGSGGSGRRVVGVPAVAAAVAVVDGVAGVAAGDRVAGGSGAGPGMC